MGTNTAAYRSASRTIGARCRSDSCTSRTIPAYVLSSAVVVANRSNAPPAFTAPGPDRVTGGAFDRARLAREGRLVQDGVRRGDAVDRDHGSRLDEQPVAAAHGVHRSLDELAVLVARDDARGPIEQRRQLPVRPSVRVGLERLPRGEHQRDHRAREVLLQGQRTAHREEGDHVDPRLASEQADHHVAEQRRQGEDGGDGPRDVRGVGLIEQPQDATAREAEDRGREPHPRQIPRVGRPSHPAGGWPARGTSARHPPSPCPARRRAGRPHGGTAGRSRSRATPWPSARSPSTPSSPSCRPPCPPRPRPRRSDAPGRGPPVGRPPAATCPVRSAGARHRASSSIRSGGGTGRRRVRTTAPR